MSETELIILGAGLAVVGGILGDEARSWLDRGRELKSIKIALCDELSQIESVILSIHTVWESAKVFPPDHVNELLATTSTYESLRTRLFLIKEEAVRTELNVFYKKIRDTVRKTEGKIGTLATTADATAEQNAFDTSFQAIGTEAKQLKAKLKC